MAGNLNTRVGRDATPSCVPDAAQAADDPRVGWVWGYVCRAVAGDVVAAVVAGVLAVGISGAAPLDGRISLGYVLILVFAPVAWVGSVAVSGGYERRRLGVGTDEFRAIPRAAIRLLAVSALVSYGLYVGRPFLSRYFVLVFFPLVVVAAGLARYGVRQWLHRARRRGECLARAVVVGRADAVAGLIADLRCEPVHGLVPVASCTQGVLPAEAGVVEAGGVRDVLSAVVRHDAQVVIMANPSELSGQELRRLSWDLDDLGIELIVAPGIVEVTGPRLSIRPAANLALLHIERPALHGVGWLTKSVLDRVVAAVWCVLLAPVFVVVAVLIKVDSRGPVFFRQERVGLDGRSFLMVKFRSMGVGAEARLAAVRAEADDGNGVLYKRRDDPRVTRVGRVLRRFSVDELPQLVNVARGDMSLVGPRPPLQREVDQYEPDAIRRLKVRPGLTGLWQVSGRSDLSWDESLRLDLRYVDNWSLMLDLQILWRTIRAVLTGAGAY